MRRGERERTRVSGPRMHGAPSRSKMIGSGAGVGWGGAESIDISVPGRAFS